MKTVYDTQNCSESRLAALGSHEGGLGYIFDDLIYAQLCFQIFEHPEISRLAKEAIQELSYHRDSDNPAESCCFAADVVTKINKY
jgi:hypothetical protein